MSLSLWELSLTSFAVVFYEYKKICLRAEGGGWLSIVFPLRHSNMQRKDGHVGTLLNPRGWFDERIHRREEAMVTFRMKMDFDALNFNLHRCRLLHQNVINEQFEKAFFLLFVFTALQLQLHHLASPPKPPPHLNMNCLSGGVTH